MNYREYDRIYSIAELDIHHIISEHVDLRGSDNEYHEYRGDCPKCSGDFAISTEYNIFHCFGCDKTGDVVDFLHWVTGDRKESIMIDLAHKYCLI